MENFEVFDEIPNEVELEIPEFAEGVEEFAPSMEVQAAEIRDVFADMEALSPENWQTLELNERLDALQDLENEVAQIAHRPSMEVVAADLSEYGDPSTQTMGLFDGEKLIISESLLMNDGSYHEVLDTLFHEGRHAYQNFNLYSGEVVEQNEELVNAWRVNNDFLGYETGEALIFKEVGFARYYTQPVEVDARAFASEVMRALNL